MIEIGFNGSMVGNLKAAAAYNGLFKGDEGGTEILMLEFILNIGYIDNDITGEYRTALPGELYMFSGCDDDVEFEEEETEEEAKASFGAGNLRQWDRFLKCLEICKDIRIWLSHTSESICGMLFLCNYLEDKDVNIYIAECPRFIPERSKYLLAGWEMCEPENLAEYVSVTRKINQDELHAYSEKWEKLKKENAPLRAYVDDRIISVNEDFYDFILRRHIPDGEFKALRLIGDSYEEGIHIASYWLERRVEYMIESGDLEIVKDSKDKRKRILCKKQ
jgi:hypothetical protein